MSDSERISEALDVIYPVDHITYEMLKDDPIFEPNIQWLWQGPCIIPQPEENISGDEAPGIADA